MNVLPAKLGREKRTQQAQTKPHFFPAPIRGLIMNENLAVVRPGAATVLDNWICTTTGIRARGGTVKVATVGDEVESLFTYKSGGVEKLFAATETDIYDITSLGDPDTVPTADVSSQTAGYYSTQQFGTAGGDFLVCVNGADDMQLFDGSSWTTINSGSSPAITGVGTDDLSQVWSYASRLFFVESGTMSAWYLPVDSIAGAASEFSLAGVFQKGGALLFGATWSLDSGSGLDDKWVVVSTEGEVAVYEGTNPGSSTTWSLVGVYQIAEPIGINATMKAGGDLLIATKAGIVPISSALTKDLAALADVAVSAPIATAWSARLSEYDLPWEIVKWPDRSIMLVSMANSIKDSETFVCNTKTGAWSRFTNIGARCMAYFNGYVYAGGNDGYIKVLETGGSDMGTPYTAVYVGAFESLDGIGMEKTVLMIRPKFLSAHPITAHPITWKATVRVDYSDDALTAPASIDDFGSSFWDVAEWDVDLWDGGQMLTGVSASWVSVGRTGSFVAPEVQMTFGTTGTPLVELVSIDATYRPGALVT